MFIACYQFQSCAKFLNSFLVKLIRMEIFPRSLSFCWRLVLNGLGGLLTQNHFPQRTIESIDCVTIWKPLQFLVDFKNVLQLLNTVFTSEKLIGKFNFLDIKLADYTILLENI